MRGYRLCFLSAGSAIHAHPVIERKRTGTERQDAATTPKALWDFSFVRSCLSLFASIFLSCLTHIASLHSSPVGLSPPSVKAFGTFSQRWINVALDKALLFQNPHPRLSQVAPRTYLRPRIQIDIFPACFFWVFITWVKRKRKVKECNPETLSCSCSDRPANIPPADSWHAIVTCWILFHTARPLVECVAFMSLCVAAVSCCSSRRLYWTCHIWLI